MQLESSRPVGVRALAHFARRSFADKLRKNGAGQVTALLGGWNEVRARRSYDPPLMVSVAVAFFAVWLLVFV